jgi:hypothetical protein
MAGKGIESIIAEYLKMGDIARMRDDPDNTYMSTKDQIYRIGPDARDSSRQIKTTFEDGSMPYGVSEMYRDTITNDFIGADGFDNRPTLSIYNSESGGFEASNLMQPEKDYPDINRMELYLAETLALQRKAEAGEASPEELDLLDAYNEFLRTRTGM